jgi:iron complex outermembrane receptor protein
LVGLLLLLGPVATAEDEAEDASVDGTTARDEGPQERVTVTAAIDEVTSAPIGSSTALVEPEKVVGEPRALTDLVVSVPGVSENGQGGLFQVFSVRGISRHRVQHLVSGARVTSERRAGPSASFFDPRLMGSVEVVRGSATTLNGSGAMGGVVQVVPRRFDGAAFSSGYESKGDQYYLAGGVGGESWSAGIARREANDGEAADGTLLNSHFEQTSASFAVDWGKGTRRYELVAIPSRAEEIGKSSTDFPERTTTYPRERHLLLQFGVETEAGWDLKAFVHPHDLQTRVVEETQLSRVENDSFDYGARWSLEQKASDAVSIEWGAQLFGRAGVDAHEVSEDTQDPGNIVTLQTLDDARSIEAGLFAVVGWEWAGADWQGGTRLSWLTQDNGDSPQREDSALNGFVGVSRQFGNHWELRGNLSTGVRFPSLSELFFTGTTGRGGIIGNPDLEPERSYGAEMSLFWRARTLLLGGTVYHNRIRNYIERVEIDPDLLTFVNLTDGTINGIELQGLHTMPGAWRLGWGGHWIRGRDHDDRPLADVPPAELYVDVGRSAGSWSYELRLAHRSVKSDPGPSEKRIPSAELLGASVAYRVSPRWSLSLAGMNLLDKEYFRSADGKAPLAPGRSVAIQIEWNR